MATQPPKPSKRPLEPEERIAEVLFGLIMVLTFTGSLSVADAGRDDVRSMLVGALGCNLAWGIIDGLFYLMGCLSEEGRRIRSWRALREASSSEEAKGIIADALPPEVAAALGPEEYDSIHQKLLQTPEPASRPRLLKKDWLAALVVALWVFLTTFPVAVPFIFMGNLAQAMRMSNAIAVALLFVSGYSFGRISGLRPWLTGLAMVALGILLVGLTMALGG
jgi:VIT1/CCC1 family predicted Fe2+/Mn2+ transporter